MPSIVDMLTDVHREQIPMIRKEVGFPLEGDEDGVEYITSELMWDYISALESTVVGLVAARRIMEGKRHV